MEHKNIVHYLWGSLGVLLIITLFIDRGIFLAFLFLGVVLGGTFFLLHKYHLLTKTLIIVLCLSFLLHFLLIMGISYTGFRPVGGGADYEGYQRIAEQTSQRFRQGNFSLDDSHYGHDFPIVIAVIYMFFGSNPLVGKFFVLWLFMMAVLCAYLIVRELGGSEKHAFFIALCMMVYPSYCYFGSLLLKDTLVIPSIFLGVLLLIRMTKVFSWSAFLFFFFITAVVCYLRFYVGYALILSFIISWFLSSQFLVKKRMWFGILLTILIGFSPALANQGYFGYTSFMLFLNPEKITLYREISYNHNPFSEDRQSDTSGSIGDLERKEDFSGTGSSFVLGTGFHQGIGRFIKNSFISFTYAVMGPFVWQLRYKRQLVSLIETIPWYLFIITTIYFLIGFIQHKKFSGLLDFLRKTSSLWVFSILAFGALSLFINNYGIIARIRIPMWICLIIMMSLLLKKENLWKRT